jgi:hypothetical protein
LCWAARGSAGRKAARSPEQVRAENGAKITAVVIVVLVVADILYAIHYGQQQIGQY